MFFNEYALLIAIGLPVAVVVGIQVHLFICGERGTLLIPGFDRYPSVEIARDVEIRESAPVAMVVTPAALSPIEVEPPVVVAQEPAPAPRPAPRAAPAPAAPPVVSAEGKRQCPKCGLYETERGSVIGWYCKVCGWREARR